MHRVSIVVPALNEATNLPHVLPLIPRGVHEVILVDGQSTDGTVTVARGLLPRIRIVQQHDPGKGSALRTGFSAATGEIIVMLDADGSMDPREIPRFIDALTRGADLVKGSRFLRGGGTADMPLYRKLGNAAFVRSVRLLFGGMSTDLCYGYSAFWVRILPQLKLDAAGFEIETQMALRARWAGLRVVEVPSFEARRMYGSSNLQTIPDGWRVTKQILRERFRSPIPRGSATIASGQRVAGIPVMPEFAGIPVMPEFVGIPVMPEPPGPYLADSVAARRSAEGHREMAGATLVEIAPIAIVVRQHTERSRQGRAPTSVD